jgi:hypothetical protein
VTPHARLICQAFTATRQARRLRSQLKLYAIALQVLHRLELVHHEETTGHFSLRLFLLSRLLTVDDRGVANAFVKEAAERSETLKAHFEADVSHTKVIRDEKFFSFLDAPLDQVLMRGLIERLPKKTKEVISREASLFRNLLETQRMIVAMVNKITRAP